MLYYIIFAIVLLLFFFTRYSSNSIIGYWRQDSDGSIYSIKKISFRTFKTKDVEGNITWFNRINYNKNHGYIHSTVIYWDNGETWTYQFGKY